MKKIYLMLLFCLIIVFIPVVVTMFPLVYAVGLVAAIGLFTIIYLKIIHPVWIIAVLYVCAPFVDILRATYFKNFPFLGIYHEIILVVLLFGKIITIKNGKASWRFYLTDYLVVIFIAWNLFQVIQSPSLLGGLYVWRWYSVGPLTYLIFRLYSFTKKELKVIIISICTGLIAAAIFVFYQYLILGPANAAQISQSLGFTAFYRIGWRLPGPFSSPLVASAAYSILVLFGMALFFNKRVNWIGIAFIVIGCAAVLMTLSRSGIAISLVGFVAIAIVNFKKIKNIIIPAALGLFLLLQLSSFIPETRQFLNYVTNPELDTYDIDRVNQFKYILTNALTKYPLGIGFVGGGAVSQQAFAMFGGERQIIPKYIGGDSVLLATLQTSGFPGLLLLGAIYFIFITHAFILLMNNLDNLQRTLCLVSLGFFLGTLVSLGNLTDVWPLKMYLWSFGGIVMNIQRESRGEQFQFNTNLLEEGRMVSAD